MENADASRAQAETTKPETESATPPTTGKPAAATAATATKVIDPAKAIETGNLDEIRALMRASSGVIAGPKDNWTGLDEQQPAREEKPAKSEESEATEAEPGDEEEEDEDEEAQDGEQEEEEEEQEEGEAEEKEEETEGEEEEQEQQQPKGKEKDKAEKTGDKDPQRVRVAKFSADDRAIIAHMAKMDSPSYEGARAELIAAGTLKPKADAAQAEAKAAEAESSEATATAKAIETKTAEITALEKEMADAGTAFDTKAIATLTIKHNKALAELGKLESQAEQERSQAQARETVRLQSAVSESESAAVELFPDAGVKDTPLYKKIVELMAAAPRAAFTDPDYPLTFAAKAARAIGYKAPAAKADKPPLKIVPKKPAKPVAPASGSTASATTRKSTADTRAQEALAGNDVEKIRAALREKGTRTLEL